MDRFLGDVACVKEGVMQYLGNDWHDILKPVSGIEVRISWKVGDMQYMRYIFSMIVYWTRLQYAIYRLYLLGLHIKSVSIYKD